MPITFIDVDDRLCTLRIRFDEGGTKVYGLDDLRHEKVWYNPGSFEQLEQGWFESEANGRFRARQFSVALEILESVVAEFCVDRPDVMRRWANKLFQLWKISEALPGLLPRTSMTGEFSDLTVGHLVKHVGESRWIGGEKAFYCQVVTAELIEALSAAGKPLPLITQERVHADHEFRSFVFGHEEATVRFPHARLSPVPDLQFHPEHVGQAEVVPAPVGSRVWSELGETLGLSFFSVDYMMVEDRLRLLEVNPAFGFAWLPAPCVDAIAGALSRHLSS
ncbi:ATP-grasp domain-containing protein [Phytohabitans flavus]|uniref:ATP-grasp domain-containing protein n=1 Tax=Phytohabitans flavus TaxID=1076124 RepID=UPI00156458B5|nr:hypothetical protein [Phytohabitans flavus]